MRTINYIVIHCSATRPSQDIGVKEIDRMHREKCYLSIGYHYVIRRDGTIETGRPLEKPGAHVEGYNKDSIGVCLVGGMNEAYTKAESNFTQAQWDSLAPFIKQLKEQFPEAEVLGHRDFPDVKKECPCFDVGDWWDSVTKDTKD